MSNMSAVIAMFSSHESAEVAVKALEGDGVDLKAISIVGKGHQTEETVVGYYTTTERMKYWGKTGAFWGGVWGLLFGSAVFMIPGMGALLVAGPVVASIVGALEGAAMVGGLSVIGAGLYSIGVPEDSIVEYEGSLNAGKFMLVVNGSRAEVTRVHHVLGTTDATDMRVFYAEAEAPVLV
jgi:hypothetical protein